MKKNTVSIEMTAAAITQLEKICEGSAEFSAAHCSSRGSDAHCSSAAHCGVEVHCSSAD